MPVAAVPPSRLVILGHPVVHSRSPAFQNAALQHLGMPQRYETLDVPPSDVARVLHTFAAENVGGNVTAPLKEAVAALASCTPLAERVGAVNTFWFEGGVLVGHNTDVEGVRASVAALMPVADIPHMAVAVLGAGGAAAAALVALADLGCSDLRVTAQTPQRAKAMLERIGVRATVTTLAAAVRDASLVINATPVGMYGDDLPVPLSALSPSAAIIDLVYRAGQTPLVRACHERNLAAIDGTTMLLAQGAAAFTCWFGVPAPIDVMRAALADAMRLMNDRPASL